MAIGVMVYLAVVRMSRERFLPEEYVVSRLIARLYQPTLVWILQHKKQFMVVPVLILCIGMTIWLGLGLPCTR